MSSIRQTIIEDYVDSLCKTLNLQRGEAFERLAHSLCTGISINDFDESDWVDGTQDKQIDLITIVRDETEATIYLISAKLHEGFSSNALIHFGNGLSWVLSTPRAQVDTISNLTFREKIHEAREALRSYGYSNVDIKAFFVSKGLTETISFEFQQEAEKIKSAFGCEIYKSFTFEPIGAKELVDLVQREEKKARAINAEITIKYDANTPSLIRYASKGRKGLICTASGEQIAELVNADETGALFDSNVRRFLGKAGAVNREITVTATDEEESNLFWFLNNGITILCDSFDASVDPDEPCVFVKNLQIVNGCQTASSLALAAKSGQLKKDAHVLLKIFEAKDELLASKIVLTTNNQNRISSRDLKANDPVQSDIRNALLPYGLVYEHKLNQYLGANLQEGQSLVSNERFAQAYLAVILKKPSDASRRKYKIWSEYYDRIFGASNLDRHVLAYWTVERAYSWAKLTRRQMPEWTDSRRVASTGVLQIALIANSYFEQENDKKSFDEKVLLIKGDSDEMNKLFANALTLLVSIIKNTPAYAEDIDLAVKSGGLDDLIVKSFEPKTGEQARLDF